MHLRASASVQRSSSIFLLLCPACCLFLRPLQAPPASVSRSPALPCPSAPSARPPPERCLSQSTPLSSPPSPGFLSSLFSPSFPLPSVLHPRLLLPPPSVFVPFLSLPQFPRLPLHSPFFFCRSPSPPHLSISLLFSPSLSFPPSQVSLLPPLPFFSFPLSLPSQQLGARSGAGGGVGVVREGAHGWGSDLLRRGRRGGKGAEEARAGWGGGLNGGEGARDGSTVPALIRLPSFPTSQTLRRGRESGQGGEEGEGRRLPPPPQQPGPEPRLGSQHAPGLPGA